MPSEYKPAICARCTAPTARAPYCIYCAWIDTSELRRYIPRGGIARAKLARLGIVRAKMIKGRYLWSRADAEDWRDRNMPS